MNNVGVKVMTFVTSLNQCGLVPLESEDGRMADGAVGQAAGGRVLIHDGDVGDEGADGRGLGQLIIIIICEEDSGSSVSVLP